MPPKVRFDVLLSVPAKVQVSDLVLRESCLRAQLPGRRELVKVQQLPGYPMQGSLQQQAELQQKGAFQRPSTPQGIAAVST